MPQIVLDIASCRDCPYIIQTKVYTADSFEDVAKWSCGRKANKIIREYVEIFDAVPVPKWCPILLKPL